MPNSKSIAIYAALFATGTGIPVVSHGELLEEILVTAQKRSENLQDVPISITQFGADEIAKLGANDFRDLDGFIPNVVQTGLNSGLEPNITIRGISSETRNSGFESGASMYVDGVYVGRPTAFFSNLADIESLEILRGPQGTLFGKNTIAGAINATTLQPGDDVTRVLEARAGNYDLRYFRGAISGPIAADTFFGGVSFFSAQRDGFQTNIGTGQDQWDKDEYGWRANFRYEASRNLEFILAIDGFEDDSRQPIFRIVSGLGADCCGSDLFTVATDIDPIIERELGGQSLTVNYDIENGATLTSITAVRENNVFFAGDTEGTTFDFLSSSFSDNEDQFTQELRYASPLGSQVPFVIGFYYYDQEIRSDRMAFAGSFVNVLFGIPPLVVLPPIDLSGEIETTSYAIFGQADFRLGDSSVLNVGLRYTDEERELTRFSLNGNPGFNIETFSDVSDVVNNTVADDEISWTVSLSHDVSDSVTGYIKAAEGFKSGGFNMDFVGLGEFALDFNSETARTYEIGLKSEFWNDRVRLNTAVFQTDYEDLQVSRFVTLGQLGAFTIDNAAESEIQGLEAEVLAIPVDNLEISATAAFLDTEFTSFEPGTQDDFTGNEFEASPEKAYSLAVQYHFDLNSRGSLYLRGEYTYRDHYFDGPENDPSEFIGSNNLTNARIGYVSKTENWTIEAYGRNLSDRVYVNGYSTPPTGLGVNVGEPRTYGLRAVFDF